MGAPGVSCPRGGCRGGSVLGRPWRDVDGVDATTDPEVVQGPVHGARELFTGRPAVVQERAARARRLARRGARRQSERVPSHAPVPARDRRAPGDDGAGGGGAPAPTRREGVQAVPARDDDGPVDRSPGRDEQGDPGADAGAEPAADPGAVAAPTLKVAAVARRLGVAPATLRTWARRYDLGPSAHTAGAHRQYSLEDLERLMVMRRMTLEGYSPAEAARVAVQSARATSAAPSVHDPSSSTPSQAPSPTAAQAGPPPAAEVPAHAASTPPARGRGEAPAPRGATPSVRSLARAAMALQAGECQRLLEAHMAVGGVVEAWTGLVRPVLEALSDRVGAVAPGRSPVALLEAALLAALRAAVEAEPPGGPAVLVLRPCA
ncbi:MerR family transcriptional regulator, partial [Pseudokineococcus marinus]|nr:MerR family transcriptional regulator [Pseudokineococcus marinus]